LNFNSHMLFLLTKKFKRTIIRPLFRLILLLPLHFLPLCFPLHQGDCQGVDCVMSGFLSQAIVKLNCSYADASPPVVIGSVTVAGPSNTVPSCRTCLYITLRPSPVSNSSERMNLCAGSSSSYIPSNDQVILTEITSVSGVPSPS